MLVPLLLQQSWQQASTQLERLGLKARRVAPRQECMEAERVNQVQRQHPAAGSLLPLGATVDLITCPPVVVDKQRITPDLSGLDLGQAKRLLQGMGLQLRASNQGRCLDPFLQNKIIGQTPAPRTPLNRGAVVFVQICRGQPQ